MKCARKGCTGDARWQLGFKVYAAGFPKTARNCLRPRFDLGVCQACSEKIDLADYLTPDGKERLQNALLARGLAPVDFSTAELELHPILDGRLDMGPF